MLFGNAQRKPQGLFGGFAQAAQQQMPQDDPMGGAGMGMQQAMQQAPAQMMGQGGQQFAQEQAPKKPGINWWGVVADALAGAAGKEGPWAAQMQVQRQQEAAREHAQQQRMASMQDWRTKFDIERANPAPHQPDDFERSLLGAGVQPGTQEWADAHRQRSLNFTDPTVNIQTPTGWYTGPRSGAAAAMQNANGGQQPIGGLTPVGKLKPMGGASGNVGGGFQPIGLQGESITSTYRTPERNKAVGGVPNSFHTRRGSDGRPMARDSTPPPGMSMASYAALLRRQNPHLDVINEGDHVHMEPK